MIQLSRRLLLASAATAALFPAAAMAQDAPDLSKLAEPPANGEVAEGSADAKVTVIEYASASCPHCADFFLNVYPALKKDYIDTGKVRFLFREFPHNDAGLGGFMIARCAPPDKYMGVIGALFKTQATWMPNPLEGLKAIALQAGFTEQSFNDCIKNVDVAQKILEERKRAEGFGVTGIPTIFIKGSSEAAFKRYEGDHTIEGLKAVIDPLLG
ncbi:MAG: DsbA family protein [Rhizobiales bacterium]|nr:DsbA family protein [Hyphomicrobiales bacterium]